ncbi:MAG: hypothetical protein B0D96_12395 [Candidatus Sedimenticola endophacoides]|uniref:Response regulatory domain-containing protein n=1 Tax=Candidatus Sedimenticola endophacoides TaxID=2548426 RepID=A0A6N4E724_9GAMM|nr:MAG: hypothetical protein B0D94_02670 [Candidatus Sedimenticola endophacoides]OQX33022.1 MAG: hypothetical protein B0D96_12395 [Candidatus Sedimenticola endophacoides]OQX42565.1 MAG: hypothetical protein B0D89_01025 [Candidatus Sedimenticola endophacoides]OQX47894.1 MAG: hypothetical protein B0D87_08345 [Candidatus Sedimenticola endophacoides]PUD97935.1 MAG: hypothetical protein C3L26_14235 [Candidatus Sedimenticola endophacoides]
MTGERFNATALLIRESTREAVEQILGAVPNIDLQVVMGATHQTLSRLRDSNLPDIILVEINGRSSNDISDIETLLANHREKLTVFVTYDGGDIDTMRRLMRAGVHDAFPQPLDPSELTHRFNEIIGR